MPARIRLLVATLWAGSLWTVGYLVAPVLFATLDDKTLAGTIAGRMFRVEAWLCVTCGVLLAILVRYFPAGLSQAQIRRLGWLIAVMLGCTLLGYFGLQPFMAALRETAGPGGVMEGDARLRFGMLHGVSSVFFLLQSLFGVALVLNAR